ncbi:hypothetical protein QQ045_023227 [Rhodiola kirilowii]
MTATMQSAVSTPSYFHNRSQPSSKVFSGLKLQSPKSMASSGSASSTTEKEESPLWQFVEKGDKTGPGGGNVTWKCKICGEYKQGTLTRVKAHLLSVSGKGSFPCKDVTVAQQREMTILNEEYEAKRIRMAPRAVPLPSGPSIRASLALGNSYSSGPTNKRRCKSDLEKSFNNQARSELDCAIARMFYTSGLPFSLARNPNYVRCFTMAPNSKLSGYLPPGYNQIRTTLLENEKKHLDLSLALIKSTWGAKGVTIVSDGWSDPSRWPLINFIVCSESGPMFIKAVDCSGEVKGGDFIAHLFKKVIDEVGEENVVQVITDNASNCKAAEKIIEGYYPHIYWTPCVVHTLNLALKNICAARNINNNEETYIECHWITEIHKDVVRIKNFIVNHGMRLSIYMRFSALKLLSVAETRFASVVIMLKRFKLVKSALESMVVCDQWTTYKDDDQAKARFVRDTILNEDWWDKVNYILAFTTPIYDMIRVCDTDKPCLHLVYEMWDVMIEKVRKVIYEHEHIENEDFEFASCTFYMLCIRYLLLVGLKVAHHFIVSSFVTPTRTLLESHHMWMMRFRLSEESASKDFFLTQKIMIRNNPEYLDERTRMWDIGGDEFGTLENTGILEFADLSLDEPEMESMLFEDDPGPSPLSVSDIFLYFEICGFAISAISVSRFPFPCPCYIGYNYGMFGFAPYGPYSPYGPYWRELRKIATLELLSTKRIELLKHVRVFETHSFIHELYKSCYTKLDMKELFGKWLDIGGHEKEMKATARELDRIANQ